MTAPLSPSARATASKSAPEAIPVTSLHRCFCALTSAGPDDT